MSRSFAAVALGLLLLGLAGCRRPHPPAEDRANPEHAPRAVEPEPEPAEVEVAASPIPVQPWVEIIQPAANEVLLAGQPLAPRIAVRLDGAAVDAVGYLVLLDSGDPIWCERPQPADPPAAAEDESEPAAPAAEADEPSGVALLTVPPLGELTPGVHLLRVVAVDSAGLGQEPQQFAAVQFQVGEPEAGAAEDDAAIDLVGGPLLTVGQPFGAVGSPDSEGRVAVSLRLDGVTLSADGDRLQWRLGDGEATAVTTWPLAEPLLVGPCAPGENRLTIWLESADGVALEPIGLTRVERSFTVTSADVAE